MGVKELIRSLHDEHFDHAACIGHIGVFDSYDRETNEPIATYRLRLLKAQAICSRCPVLTHCKTTARKLPRNQRHGIWAGIDLEEKRNRRAA